MPKNSSLQVLVIGGAGYIGSHVVKALIDAGHHTTVFDNLSSGLRHNLFAGIPFIYGDILHAEQIQKAAQGMDVMVHLAGLKAAGESMIIPEQYAHHNITGSINILNAACQAGIKKFIFSSSAAVYGDPQYTPMDEKHPTDPTNFYGFNKLQIEGLLKWYDQLKGLRYVSLRYFNATGYDVDGAISGLEQNPQNLYPIIMETVMGKRDHVKVFGDDYDTPDGTCIRDYIHVSDLAAGHVQALEYLLVKERSDIFNLGTSSGISVFEVLEATKRFSKVDIQVEITSRRAGDPPVVLADSGKAHQILNWKAKYSDAQTIIQSMLKVYQSQSNLD